MNRARSYRRAQAGFTLIEIMVAMTILVVLVGGVYVCFASVATTAEIAREASESLRLRQFLWNQLRDDLASISAKPDGEYALIGEDGSGPFGDADTLRFATSLPLSGAKSLPGIVKLVEYYIDDGSGDGEGLFRTFDGVEREEQEGTTLFITEKPLVLLAGGDELFPAAELRQDSEEGVWEREIPIRSFNVEYYDGLAEEWTPEWNSDELGFLPWAVRIQINLAKTKAQLEADRAAGVDPTRDFDLEMVAILPAGSGVLGEFLDPNHYRSTDQAAEAAGEG